MTQREIFGAAQFVGREDKSGFAVLRGHFQLKKKGKATLRVVGLGFFTCYINGQRVSDDRFLPLFTDYEARKDYPSGETLTGHRLYVPEYDISDLVTTGDNLIAISFGGGWYTITSYRFEPQCRFGDPKAIWRVITDEGDFVSSEQDLIAPGYVTDYEFSTHEFQDRTGFDPAIYTPDFDESGLSRASLAEEIKTEYLKTDCPADRVIETVTPKFLCERDGVKVYDAGKNLSGVPVFRLGEQGFAEVFFSEECTKDWMPDPDHNFKQEYRVRGKPGSVVSPDFTWFGFRYFSVVGDAEPMKVEFIHTDLPVTSSFESDNEMLNWIYRTSLHTEFCNLHTGVPSDCPHIERLGYTGDGQLTALSLMTMTDAKPLYRKWIGDILDCQDTLTGHVQYTAPYFRCGGGPGAWGCAIVEMPYLYYKQYGDDSLARAAYPQMKRYFDYLEAHSVDDLVASDKAGEWCLGDWCTQTRVVLPAAFVNNYYYVRSLTRAVELAKRFGYDKDIPEFEDRIARRKAALTAAYFNTWDGNFIGCLQGANAFMVDLGLGDERTYNNLVRIYSETGALDTGICGTEVLLRVLCEHGDVDLAVKLLSPDKPVAFRAWRDAGATTLWEYFCGSTRVRSHNHPMFGSAVTNLFRYLLGIKDAGEAGFDKVTISPYLPDGMNRLGGYQTVPKGKISVSMLRTGDKIHFSVTVPENLPATFRYGDVTLELKAGTTELTV